MRTKEHIEKIRQKAIGRKASEKTKEKFKLMLKEKHPRALQWVLIDPNEKMFIVDSLLEFCELNKLSYSIFRHKAQIGDCTPISRGTNKGWVVFGTRLRKP